MQPLQLGVVEQALDQFAVDVAGAIPNVLAGLVFLVLAGVVGKLVMMTVRALLQRTLPDESDVYRRFIAGIVAAFLWFSIGLSFLAIVGLDGIASSMGTAAGFLALGVSYSLSSMIADAVAGVYLLRDPDFMPGDRVEVGDVSGVVTSIELRKTRFRDENDDTVVRGNAEIEKKWTKLEDVDSTDDGDGDEPSEGPDEGAEAMSDEVAEDTADRAERTAEDTTDDAVDATEDASESAGDAVAETTESTFEDDSVWSEATDG